MCLSWYKSASLHQGESFIWTLLPCELQGLRHWHFVLCCDFVATLAEQLCLPRWKASFPTRLRCVICAPRAFGLRRCADGKSFLLRQKRKIRNTRMGIPQPQNLTEASLDLNLLCEPKSRDGFCAPRAFGLRRCADGKSFLLRPKKKKYGTP